MLHVFRTTAYLSLSLITASVVLFWVIFLGVNIPVYAAINPEINYQGKLTTPANVAVPDGTYNMRFWILTSPTIATTSALWSEELTGADKVQVVNGLFSVMLGSTTPFSGIDWNQTLYLGVEIGGSTTPLWDGEMSPRKVLGTVPAAFVADTLDGLESTQFVRTDATSTVATSSADTLLTITQNGAGDILNLFDGSNEIFSVLDGGNIGIGSTSPSRRLTVQGGDFYLGGNMTATGTLTVSGLATLGYASTTALTVSGNTWLTYASSTGLTATNLFGTTITGTNLTTTYASSTALTVLGRLYDNAQSAGTAGMVMQTTGSGVQWVATSTLGFGNSNWTYNGSRLAPSSTVGIGVFASSTIGDGTATGGLTINGGATTTGNAYFASNVGIGSTTPSARLSIHGTAGDQTPLIRTASSTGSTTFAVLASGDVEVSGNLVMAGVEWTARQHASTSIYYSIAYGNGTFVAVGRNSVMRSSDGINWATSTPTENNNWSSVTYGNGLFVSVSFDGTNRVMTSPDGVTWTARSATQANSWYSVTYGNGLFVAVSINGSNRVMTSPDGVTWTARSAPQANAWYSVTYGSGRFVAVSQDGGNRVMTSFDGITWTARSAAAANTWTSITYGNGLFVAMSGGGTNAIMTSPDGITWTARNAVEANQWTSITYGSGLFVAVASSGTNRVMTSPDGVTWTARTAAEANWWQSVTYGSGRFVAVSQDGGNRVMTSGKPTYTELAHNNIYQGGMSVLGGVFNIGTTTSSTNTLANNILNIASTTGTSLLTMNQSGYLGLGTTTPSRLLTVIGDIYSSGNITATGGTITYASSTALTVSGNTWLTYASSTGFTASNLTATNLYGTNGYFTLASTTYASTTNLSLFGKLFDTTNSAGSNGYVLQTTGSGVQWVATTSLGFGGGAGDGVSNWSLVNGALAPSSTVGIVIAASSTISDLSFTNATGTNATTTNLYASNLVANTITGTNFATTFASSTALTVLGRLYDNAQSAGTAGMVMQTTGSGVQWVATSSLGFGNSNWTYNGSRLAPSSTVGIGVFASSTIGDGTATGGLTINGGATTTGNAYFASNLGIGSTTPSARLSIHGTAGDQTPLIRTASSTGSTTFAVLASGDVEVSRNLITAGVEWTARRHASTSAYESVTYGNGTFVAVGQNAVMRSSDGINWATSTPAEYNNWLSVTYGNGLFVAVSGDGTNRVMTSPDGITWTARSAAEANGWQSVTYGNGLFVAVANDGTNRVMTSRDGITWTARSAAEANGWVSVTYGNGLFVAVSFDGTNRVMTSPDGITWTARSAAQANAWYSVTYGNGLFVAVAGDGTNRVMTSPDGITWTARSAAEANTWAFVTYGNGLFVAVACGLGGLFCNLTEGGSRVMTSPDGITWRGRIAAVANFWQSVTYGNGMFVAVSSDGTNRVMTSGKPTYTELAHNNIYQGGMSVLGGAFNIGTTTSTTNTLANNILNIASTTGTSLLTMNQSGYLGLGTTTPSRLLTVIGDIYSSGNLTVASATITYASSTALTVSGNTYLNYASSTALTVSGNTYLTYASSTGLTATNLFGTTITGTNLSTTYASSTALTVLGRLYDNAQSAGTAGMVMQTTGSGVQWVATSSLGFGNSNWTYNGSRLSPSTTVGIGVFASSTIGGGTGATGLTISGNSTTTLNQYIQGSLAVSTTSDAKIAVHSTGNSPVARFTGYNVAGVNRDVTLVDVFGTYEFLSSGYNLYGVRSAPHTDAFVFISADNTYAFYGSPSGGVVDWGIYLTGEDKNYMSGQLGIGTTTPAAKLSIHNTASSLAPLFSVASSTNGTGTTTAFLIDAYGRSIFGYASSTALSGTNLSFTNATLTYASSTALTVSGNTYLTYASSTGLTATNLFGTTITGTNLSTTYASSTALTVLGRLYDNAQSAGTAGMVMQTTGSGVQWVATSSLGFGNSNWTYNGSRLAPSSTVGIGVFASSTIGDGTATGGLTISGNGTTTLAQYIGTTLAIGTTTPAATLAVIGAAGSQNLFNFASSTGSTLLALGADGRLMFGTTTSANIFLNGGPTSTNPLLSLNTNNIAIGNQAFSYPSSTSATTNNIALGYEALYGSSSVPMTGSNNFAGGYQALKNNTTGTNNNAFGSLSLSSNTIGSYNNALGPSSLYSNTTGTNNNALGQSSLQANTTGSDNNALGQSSLQANTTGSDNNALGALSLFSNTTGSYNNALGALSLFSNDTGSYNNALGYWSLFSNTTGSGNSAFGAYALQNNSSGASSTALGSYAGYTNMTGRNNLYLGDQADSVSADLSNAIAIGSHAQVAASHSMVLGGSGIWNTNIVTGTSTPWAKLSIQNNYGSTTPLFDIATTTSSAFATSSLFRVNHDGTVGIGSSTPSRLLTVAGNAYVGGNLTVTGSITGTNASFTYASTTALTVSGNTWLNYASSTALTVSGNTWLTYASSTGLTATNLYGTTITGTNLTTTYASSTALTVLGRLYDNAQSAGTAGMVMQTTGSGVQWVATSTLGITAAGDGVSNWLVQNGALAPSTTLGITIGASSTIQGLSFLNATGTNATTTNFFSNALTATNALFTYASSTALTVSGNTYLTYASSTGLTATNLFGTTITGTNLSTTYASSTALTVLGRLYDNAQSAGTAGMVMQTTGSGVQWVATSSLGFGNSNWTYNGSRLSPSTTVGIGVFASSTIGGGTGATGLTINGGATTTGRFTIGTNADTDIFINSGSTTLTAGNNVAIGNQALRYFAAGAIYNTALGYQALYGSSTSPTIGTGNFAGGYQALYKNTTGTDNNALGVGTLFSNTTGSYNNAFGASSLTFNTTGTDNNGLGNGALLLNTTGSNNNALGLSSLVSNTTGSGNIGMGYLAGDTITTGNNNIFLGWNADATTDNFSTSTAIGANATVGCSNCMVLGGLGTDYANVGIGTTTPSRLLTVQGGDFWLGGNMTATGTLTVSGLATLGYASTTALTVSGNTWLNYASSTALTVSGNTYLTYASSTALTATNLYGTTITGTNLSTTYASSTALTVLGRLYDNAQSAGTAGMVMQTTGSGVQWVATSSLGFGNSNWTYNGSRLAPSTTVGIGVFASSTIGDGTATGGLTINGGATTTGNAYFAGTLSLGSTSPEGLGLTINKSGVSGSVIAGIKEYFNFANTVESALYYGDNVQIINTPTATSTLVGKVLRITDNTTLGNTVRGMEIQAHRGTNTKGENTGISAFGRTFGLRGTTEADAGDTFVPAGVYAETRGSTQGSALRAYSGSITTSSLVSFFHDTSNFTGTGLLMNFGNSGGTFQATTTAKFIDLQVNGTSKFMVAANGSTTIGDGSVAASLRVPFGGICVDNDGSCSASTTGRITSVSSALGNSDLAEIYFASDALETGEIVALKGGLSIERADSTNRAHVVGVVSTKPGTVLGYDDTSLVRGESAYPVGLKGRVPVMLSTENGPIKKGDRITLSSIPGVGMKATESDIVVGIALEDYAGEHAYSAGYLNQFGDDLVKRKITEHANIDPRTQDGCSYGAGNEEGEAPCVKEIVDIKPQTYTIDTKTDILEELSNQKARSKETPEGEVVMVGQALMFIDLAYYTAPSEADILAALNSTSSLLTGDGTETLFDRLKELANAFVDGVLRVAGIKTDKLCVGEVCVDEATFLRMVESASNASQVGNVGASDGDVSPSGETTTDIPEATTDAPVSGGGTGEGEGTAANEDGAVSAGDEGASSAVGAGGEETPPSPEEGTSETGSETGTESGASVVEASGEGGEEAPALQDAPAPEPSTEQPAPTAEQTP